MSDLVSAVIKPKGRIINQFLEYFAVQLFPEKEELLRETVQVLERDKHRLKEQARRGENPLSQREVMELLFEGYSKKFPDLRYILRVIPDYKRESQPYRVGLGSIDGVVDGQRFRLIGEVNPIETLRDNNVNFAIASSDLLLAKFVSLLPNGIDIGDPAQILANLPPDTTTIQYDGPLKINGSRHMLFMNFRPERIEVDERGLPRLEEGTVIYVNGEYYLVYKKLFNGKYKLDESEKVEPAVLIVDGRKKYGIGVVSSGKTLLDEAKVRDSDLIVFGEPIYNSTAILLSNRATRGYDRAKNLVGRILEINRAIEIPVETTYAHMASNLGPDLIRK